MKVDPQSKWRSLSIWKRLFTRKPTLADTLQPDPDLRRRILARRDAAGVQRYNKANEGLV